MIEHDASSQQKRAIELALIGVFFIPGSAAHFAALFSTEGYRLHAADVLRIWREAKARGDLPKINRPHGGPKDRVEVRA